MGDGDDYSTPDLLTHDICPSTGDVPGLFTDGLLRGLNEYGPSSRNDGYDILGASFGDWMTDNLERSLWYSISPSQWGNEDGCNNTSLTAVDEQCELLQAHSLTPNLFDSRNRDDLLLALGAISHGRSSDLLLRLRRTFPSVNLLNVLVHSFFRKHDAKIDAWIHSATFRPRSTNMELTVMIIAASAVSTSICALRRFGSDLHQLVRPVLLEKLENNCQAFPELHLLQAFLIHLELDLWHDEDNCLHSAGRFSSILSTLLRRQLGDTQASLPATPLATDNAVELSKKWSLWVTTESYKRLTTRFCVYDHQLSMTLRVRAATTFSDYRLLSPHPRELWLAANATEWRQIFLSRPTDYTPKVTDLMTSTPNVIALKGFVDKNLAIKLMFFLLGGWVLDYQLSTHKLHGPNRLSQNDNDKLRRSELETAIRCFDRLFRTEICHSNIGSFTLSYLLMTLEVSIEEVELLMGKGGEQESHRMYQVMKDWPQTPGAREAIWHAGQILRRFKLLDRLTSFIVMMAYHAGLVLLAFSVLSRARGGGSATKNAAVLYLNGTAMSQAEIFIRDGSAEPMLQGDFRGTERATTSLFATKEVTDVISEIILNRACTCEDLSPRLVNGLVNLLRDLASAMQIFHNDFQFVPELHSDFLQSWHMCLDGQ
ncbi:hypothetical protein BJX61DRAFT_543751 [Aspergillus egyptiacus]|nr:hypothetical protein BJX61DRAFT_543751 [Aspergillus egyptiacus]